MPGPSNTLLIEGSFSELAEELAQYIDNLSKTEPGAGAQSEIESSIAKIRETEVSQEAKTVDATQVQKDKDDVLKKIVTKATVLNSAPEREFTAAYNLLISLAQQSSIRDQIFARICSYLSEGPITSSPQMGGPLAVSTLSTIFNVLTPTSEARYHVFLAILKVIRATQSTQSFDALIPQLETNMSEWISTWKLDEDDARTLYTTISTVASVSGHRDLYYKYLLNALDTIPPASASEPEAASLAKKALVEAFTNPSVFDFTPLTASDAIQALRSADSSLVELLDIFSSDSYADYTSFISSTSLSSMSIPDTAVDTLATKMRLLTLASISASAPARSVPYTTIASSLEIPAEEVEMWVIDTIRAGLIEGKLSQLRQEFLVQRATYRVFGDKQWTEIQGRLMVWRRSLESVLSVVRSEREKFIREGVTGYSDEGGQKTNGYGDRRGGGGRRGNPREVDFVGGAD